MRLLVVLLGLVFVANAGAANISCKNVDEYFEEDTLEFVQEGATTYAYYFDDDSYYSVPCETTALDGYVCEDDDFTIKMYESGETYVDYYGELSIEFSCF